MRVWLKAMRLERGLCQAEMAARLSISAPYYCDIENGNKQKDMAYSMMEKLASALGVPVQEIIESENAYRASRPVNGKKVA